MEKIIETQGQVSVCAPAWLEEVLEVLACEADWDDAELNDQATRESFPLGFL